MHTHIHTYTPTYTCIHIDIPRTHTPQIGVPDEPNQRLADLVDLRHADVKNEEDVVKAASVTFFNNYRGDDNATAEVNSIVARYVSFP